MKLIFPDGTFMERPLLGKVVGAKRGNSRPSSVEFSADELRELWGIGDRESKLAQWYARLLVPCMKAPEFKGCAMALDFYDRPLPDPLIWLRRIAVAWLAGCQTDPEALALAADYFGLLEYPPAHEPHE